MGPWMTGAAVCMGMEEPGGGGEVLNVTKEMFL